jgi:hypothetical protein
MIEYGNSKIITWEGAGAASPSDLPPGGFQEFCRGYLSIPEGIRGEGTGNKK